MLKIFLQSVLIGIAIAAPVGPIGLLCIKKTLEIGLKAGLAVGFGAALADSIYGLIAGLGLTAITEILIGKASTIQLIGGILLILLAIKELRSKPSSNELTTNTSSSLPKLSLIIFFLTLTNPLTILSFLAIFATIAGNNISIPESILMVAGIFLGSMLWWTLLASIINKIHHKLPQSWIHRIKFLSALILFAFGSLALWKAL